MDPTQLTFGTAVMVRVANGDWRGIVLAVHLATEQVEVQVDALGCVYFVRFASVPRVLWLRGTRPPPDPDLGPLFAQVPA